MVQEHLGFVDQAPKGTAVHDAVAVALVVVARGGGRLRVAASARLGGVAGPGSPCGEGRILHKSAFWPCWISSWSYDFLQALATDVVHARHRGRRPGGQFAGTVGV